MEDLKGRAVRGGLAKLCGQAINLVLRLSFIIIMARLLGPEEFGVVAMVTIVTGVFEIFTTAGLSSATIQKVSVTNEQISTLFWINLLVGFALSLLCALTAPALVSFYHEPRLFWVTVTLSAAFIFSASGVQHSALLQRQLRFVAIASIETLSLTISSALGIVMALKGSGYWSLVCSIIAAPAINTVSLWLISGWIPGAPTGGVEIRSMLRFGGTITLNTFVVYLAYNFDKLLLGRFWGADALGVYGRAYQLINVPNNNLLSAIGGVLFSTLSRLQNDPPRLRNYFLTSYFLLTSMTMPISIFGAIFSDDIVLVVLGPKWSDAAAIFRLLTPTILVLGMINPTGWLLQSVGLQDRSLKIAFVIAPLVIVGYLVGLPYGPSGVASAFSAVMTLWLVPHMAWSLRDTVISPVDVFVTASRPFVASILSATIAFGVHSWYGQAGHPLFRLMLSGGTMGAFYILIFMFVMGQKALYLDILRGLKSSYYSPQILGQ